MSKDLKRDFHSAVYSNINSYIKIVKALSAQPAFKAAYDAAPDIIKNGRTIFQMVADDLLDAFATIMRNAPDDKIPASFHKQILNAREGRVVSAADAKKHLQNLMVAKRALPEGEDFAPPQFISLFTEDVPRDVIQNMVNHWLSAVNYYGQLIYSEEAIDSSRRSADVTNKALLSYQTSIGNSLNRDASLQRIVSSPPLVASSVDDDDEGDESFLDILTTRINELDMSLEAQKLTKKEMAQLRSMNPQSPDASILRKHLDVLTSLPWGKFSDVNQDLKRTEEILDEDHYGMQKVKDAIAEHVAVQNRMGTATGQILLLVGPPGIGKTSIAQSVAKATGRNYVRMALGGMRDEANIRGHRMTYVGAMLGNIIKAMIKAGTMNPLMVLDEIDKMGESTQGDPAAALLEALDPEQNHAFKDHYLNVEFDLSKVAFFSTANDFYEIPRALRDRMEVIHLPGYLHDEKFEIAKRFLAPKQLRKKGLTSADVIIDDSALHKIINEYTIEAGVRSLEQVIVRVCRKAVVAFAKGRTDPIIVTSDNLADFAGVSKVKHDLVHSEDTVGIVNGLAYTSVGGIRLPIQAEDLPSNGFRLRATGLLGEVMKESIEVAEGWVRKHAQQYGISQEKLNKSELRLHAPDGATPKDGPSAGLAMATVIISALAGVKIRHDLAMTGEIDLKGKAGKIGGLPEKLEGALRSGVKTVLIPRDNLGDLADVPEAIKSKLTIIPVDTIDDVLKHALVQQLRPIVTQNSERTLATIFAEINALSNEAAVLISKQVGNDNNGFAPQKKIANDGSLPNPL